MRLISQMIMFLFIYFRYMYILISSALFVLCKLNGSHVEWTANWKILLSFEFLHIWCVYVYFYVILCYIMYRYITIHISINRHTVCAPFSRNEKIICDFIFFSIYHTLFIFLYFFIFIFEKQQQQIKIKKMKTSTYIYICMYQHEQLRKIK